MFDSNKPFPLILTGFNNRKPSPNGQPLRLRHTNLQHPGTGSSLLALMITVTLLTLSFPSSAFSQVLYGSLTGNVTDQSGAVISGAKVEALNIGTNISKTANTDDRGGYLFNDLQPGVYKLTITASSFKTLIQDNVRIDANMLRRLDAELQTSGVNETVLVTASNEAIQADRADVNITQPTRQVNDLPLAGSAGRNYQSLMGLVPGSVLQGEQNSAAGSPQRSISFNVNGVSRMQNNTRIDGASVVYPWLPTNTVYVPPAEGIQEVNIVTNSMDAEQGLAGGAAINVIIKTGTNDFHGAGWVYDTNSALRARNYFQTTPQNPKDILVQFGYAIGGPIIKDKLFFFTDFERTTRRNTSRTNLASVAPPSLRPGSGGVTFPTAAQGGATIYDPASNANPALRTPFPNNTIPLNRIDIAAI
jgi:hypothetical protein